MAAQKIQLRKLRNFGENISDTFQFIRQEFKPFVKSVLLIAGIFILIHAIMIGSFEAKEFGMLDRITKNPYGYNDTNSLSVFTLQYFIILLIALLLMSIMHVVTSAYMKLYNENQQSPTFPELWSTFKKYFLKSFIFSIPLLLLIMVGCLFCLLPGIALGVVFAPFNAIIVNEDASFSVAFSRCFTLIKKNFWPSTGIYLVMLMIVYFALSMAGGVVGIISGVLSYFITKDIGSTMGIVFSLFTIISQLFYLALLISINLNYYNLAEQTDGAGILQRLSMLGSHTAFASNTEEQY